MKLQRRNIVLVGVAVLLGAVTLVTRAPENQPATTRTRDLFAFEEGQVQALQVAVDGRSLAFERDENQVWQMTQPDQTVANEANVAYLANLLATGVQSDRLITVVPDDLDTYGLDQPYAALDITLDNDETHQLVLGTYTFNRSNLYALVDPPADPTSAEELDVALVSADFEIALNRPLEEWKQPEESPAPAEP